MSLIKLHRDPIQAGIQLDELPLWLPPSAAGSYWHIPRSATEYGDKVCVSFWCGSGRNYVGRYFPFDMEPLEMRCGTCIGRYRGYIREEGSIFRPRDAWALPARCPGNDWEPGTRNCHACGRHTYAARGWTSYGISQHKPAPELEQRLEACPLHGWTQIRPKAWDSGGEFVCGVWRCTHETRTAPE